MLRIKLSDEQATMLSVWRRDSSLKPAERDRVEMVALSASGWSVGQTLLTAIDEAFTRCEQRLLNQTQHQPRLAA